MYDDSFSKLQPKIPMTILTILVPNLKFLKTFSRAKVSSNLYYQTTLIQKSHSSFSLSDVDKRVTLKT